MRRAPRAEGVIVQKRPNLGLLGACPVRGERDPKSDILSFLRTACPVREGHELLKCATDRVVPHGNEHLFILLLVFWCAWCKLCRSLRGCGLGGPISTGAASRAPHGVSGFFHVLMLREATRFTMTSTLRPARKGSVWRSVWGTRKGAPVPVPGPPTRTDCLPFLAEWAADSQSVVQEPTWLTLCT